MSGKKWTMGDGKTRAASEGPWIAREDFQKFVEFCRDNGHTTRAHPDAFLDAHQVHHKGHWMSLIWNKSFRRYTADRRLSLLVQSFAAFNAPQPAQGEKQFTIDRKVLEQALDALSGTAAFRVGRATSIIREALREAQPAAQPAVAELVAALMTARDHIPMDALDISHCKDAQQIRSAIAKHGGTP